MMNFVANVSSANAAPFVAIASSANAPLTQSSTPANAELMPFSDANAHRSCRANVIDANAHRR
jgi:hypothetical protein